jgi:acetyl-CoA carboxylase biotin carboxylase subunit
MGEVAVKAAQAVGYTNAGTVEFLLDRGGDFYFLEMNTRLQVEHPVTELVTGLDLVAAQLRIARGEALGPEFDGVEPRGHAIEVRLYAEDPFRGFAPSPGRITRLRLPEGPGVRNDSGVYEGAEVPIYYDPMVAKLIVWASDREAAIARLERALSELSVEGIRSNAPLFRQILRDADFRAGRIDIGTLDRKLASGEWAAAEDSRDEDLAMIAAAVAHAERLRTTSAQPAAGTPPSGRRSHWREAARREALGNRSWS